MKILLVGEHYSDNYGDGIISICFQEIIKKRNIDYELLDLSGKQYWSTNAVDTANIGKKVRNDFVRSYVRNLRNIVASKSRVKDFFTDNPADYSAVIYDGGSLFMSYFAPMHYYINKECQKRNIPIFYNACGFGKMDYQIDSFLLKRAISCDCVKYISIRDSIPSIQKLFRKKCIKTVDVGILVSRFYNRKKAASDKMGIGYMWVDPIFNDKFEKSIESLIDYFEEAGIKWELFTNGNGMDYAHMHLFFDNYQNRKDVVYGSVAPIPNNPYELVDTILTYSKILTCRLHSAIVSYSYLIPSFCVDWSDKIRSFYSVIGHEEQVLIPTFDGQYIAKKMISLEYSASDAVRLGELQNEAGRNAKFILDSV